MKVCILNITVYIEIHILLMHVENNVSSAGNLQICPIKVFSQQIPCMLTNECVKLSLGPHETHFKQEETGLAVK